MNNNRPRTIIWTLVVTAVLGFVGRTAILDVHADWGDPRQAVANVCWIMFLLSVVGLLVVGVRVLVRRRQPAAD